jgi:hypothetical protein
MTAIRGPARALCTLGPALLALCGCGRFGHDETNWARAALQRNDRLEIVAVDQDAGTFTVRVKDTGELRVVHADQIIATVPSGAAGTVVREATPSSDASRAPLPATAATPAGPESGAANTQPASSAPAPASSAEAARAAVPAETVSPSESSTASAAASDLDAADKRTLASGPGYSIKAARSGMGSSAARQARAPTSSTIAQNVAVERRSEPIICQGAGLRQIDNRNIEFAGDAVSAEDGCEIHITNSRIIASGVGISARAANVHIDNSSIEGQSGSISASDGAQVYAQSSTFKGLRRRLDTAAFHDLGGNVWN